MPSTPRWNPPSRTNPGRRRAPQWRKTAERAAGLGEIDPKSQELISVGEAIALIQGVFDVGIRTGRAKLIEACASEKVRSHYIAAVRAAPLIRLATIAPLSWYGRHGVGVGVVDLESGTFRSNDCYEGAIQINGADLRQWMARPRRGPIPGKIARYAETDRALFQELERIKREQNLTDTEAARQLAARIKGPNTTDDSKVRRLVRRYWAETNSH